MRKNGLTQTRGNIESLSADFQWSMDTGNFHFSPVIRRRQGFGGTRGRQNTAMGGANAASVSETRGKNKKNYQAPDGGGRYASVVFVNFVAFYHPFYHEP